MSADTKMHDHLFDALIEVAYARGALAFQTACANHFSDKGEPRLSLEILKIPLPNKALDRVKP